MRKAGVFSAPRLWLPALAAALALASDGCGSEDTGAAWQATERATATGTAR